MTLSLFKSIPLKEKRPCVASFGQRLKDCFSRNGQLCVGIDPSSSQLSKWGLEVSATGAKNFGYELIEASSGEVGIIKVQVAFFEQFGPAGFQALDEVLRRANQAKLLVIADAKRGDIGSTMEGYAKSWLGDQGGFLCDAVTVSPFLGPAALNETALFARQNNKGIFVLSATSNPEAPSVQQARYQNQTVSSSVAHFAKSHSAGEFGSIGLVIGATVNLDDFGLSEEALFGLPILVPGFGAQGASLGRAKDIFPRLTENIICSASRSIAGDSREGLFQRIQAASEELRLGLSE